MFSRLVVLTQIALRNLFGSLLNLFIGAIIFGGTVLLVVGGSLFDTLDRSLSKSIVGSVTGHLQVYSSRSKDNLEVYGKFDGSDSTLSPIEDFPAFKKKLLTVPNVARVVPMGTSGAILGSGNTVDLTLEKLRGLYRLKLESKTPPADVDVQILNAKNHVRQILSVLMKDTERQNDLVSKDSEDPADKAALVTASSEEFWASFDKDPYEHLELLENKISPQVSDADLLFIRYLGTDLENFQETFDRMEIADGERVPPGKRGLLIPKFFYEEYLKLKNARRLDKIKDALEAGRKISDTNDKELQRWVRENQTQTREFVLQLDAVRTAQAIERLQKILGTKEADYPVLLKSFFTVTDETFDARYKFFYAELAPLLELYRVKVGDTLNLKSFGRSGSVESVNVRVYGTFHFKGLEKSPLSGALALIDMVSFRDLYGYLTSDRALEAKAMQAQTNAKQVSRESAEDDLFGGGGSLEQEAIATKIEEATLSAGRREAAAEKETKVYTRDEIESGVVLHAAIVLKDDSPAATEESRLAIEKVLADSVGAPAKDAIASIEKAIAAKEVPGMLAATIAPVLEGEKSRAGGSTTPTNPRDVLALEGLYKTHRAQLSPAIDAQVKALIVGARPAVWVINWDAAAGVLGQFIAFFRVALVLIVFVVGLIAIIIMMIGVTIATLQRTQVIGTMRAIGAQREFVLGMVLVETLVLGIVFAAIGIGVGAGIVTWLGATGIPAFRDELYFFFSGPKLLPSLTGSSILFAAVMILGASFVSVLVPALIAIKISPLQAMQASE